MVLRSFSNRPPPVNDFPESRPKKYHIILTEEERSHLKKLANSSESKKLIRKRINILLDIDESQGKYLTYEQCVKSNATSMMNVYKVAEA